VAAFAPADSLCIFCLHDVAAVDLVQTLVVETKGASLEQISERLSVPKELVNTQPFIEVRRALIGWQAPARQQRTVAEEEDRHEPNNFRVSPLVFWQQMERWGRLRSNATGWMAAEVGASG